MPTDAVTHPSPAASTTARRPGARALMAGLCAVVVVVAGVVGALLITSRGRHATAGTAPDLRGLLVPRPAAAQPCPWDGTAVTGADLGAATAVGGGVQVLPTAGLTDGAVRCWTPPGAPGHIQVTLLRFDRPPFTAQSLAGVEHDSIDAAGATDLAAIPGVPVGVSFALASGDDSTPDLYALGVRGTTALLVQAVGAGTSTLEDLDRIAAQQYARL